MDNEEMLGELLDKIQRDINGIDLYSLPRAVLSELIRRLTAELTEARKFLSANQMSIEALAAHVNQRDAEIARLEANYNTVSTRLIEQSRQLSALEVENANLITDYREASGWSVTYHAEAAALRNENADLRKQLVREAQIKHGEYEALRAVTVALTAELTKARRLLEEDRLALIWRAERILKLEVKETDLTSNLAARQAAIEGLAAGVNQREAEITRLRAQLAESWQPVADGTYSIGTGEVEVVGETLGIFGADEVGEDAYALLALEGEYAFCRRTQPAAQGPQTASGEWTPVANSLAYDLITYAIKTGELPDGYVICAQPAPVQP